MKRALSSIFFTNSMVAIITSTLLITGCTKDESIDQTSLNNSTSSFATPSNGDTYTIQGLDSGRTLDIEDASNSNGANLQLLGTDVNSSNTNRQWEIIDTNDGYVRLKGVDSGKSLEVEDGSNSNGANVQQYSYEASTHQQWEIISAGDGYFRLKNRDSGKSLTASGGTGDRSNVTQYNYNDEDNQKWFFTKVGSDDSSSETETSSTTDDNEDNDNDEVSSSSFINTTDGTFNLDDFEIESSSHLSSSTSKTTTSWDIDDTESDIYKTEWYKLSGNYYYLKSASYDGKRTEFKEFSGNESSLYTKKEFKYEAAVDDIPEHGVTIAQVHNRGGVKRPYLRVYLEDGRINVKETTNSLTSSNGRYSAVEGPSYSENSKFKVQITTGNGNVNVKIETTSGTLEEDFTPSGDGNYKNDYYLKAGVYTEGYDTEPIIKFYSIQK